MRLLKVFTAASCVLGQCSARSLANDRSVSGNTSTNNEVPHIRSFFYTGGEYVQDDPGGHIFRDQMYVERLVPVDGVRHQTPIVFIHGQAQTGTNFLNKPDGGRGWASEFIEQGYELYIIDQTFRGRSAWQPGHGASSPSTYSAEIIQQRFTAIKDYNLWPQSQLHTQWPGTGKMGDDVFDTFYSSNVQFISNATYQERAVQNAGAALLDKIGKPVILLGHSQGGLMPMVIVDKRPELTKALILLEPTGPPFREAVFSQKASRPYGLTDLPMTYSPTVLDAGTDLVQQTYPAPSEDLVECVLQAESPQPRQLVNLANKPILLVTSESSYHVPYDYCTVKFLKQAGCSKTEHIELGKVGIHGNGHMFFMEKNSQQIQNVLRDWIEKI